MKGKGSFQRSALTREGFSGWVTFETLLEQPEQVPAAGGVYIVVRDSKPPRFLAKNPGGWFKGRDPTVPVEALRANWVEGAEVIYIGKADQLRRRLRQFAKFGAGHRIGHWGGRLIWQLGEAETLLVAWKQTPSEIPQEAESELIGDFQGACGKPPFANDPHLLGR